MTNTVTIPSWANGPDGSGNGGYSAGLLASFVTPSQAVSVSLRLPPPLGRALRVEHADAGGVTLLDVDESGNDAIIADARPAELTWQVPPAVLELDVDQAHAARQLFGFRDRHPFPRCMACGTARDSSLPSLDLHCGPVGGASVTDDHDHAVPLFADTWTPSVALADPSAPDACSAAACWSALDCPSAAPFANPDAATPMVLARITAAIKRAARVGAPHIVASWQRAVDGRKHWSSSVLVDASTRTLIGRADALWIQVRSR